jgi:uncharacterized membrane protein
MPLPHGRAGWSIVVGLALLSAVPVLAGCLRLVQLVGGPALLPPDRRFADFPAPLVVHIVAASVYAVVGIVQLLPRLRRRHPDWHRRTGRVLAVAGLLVAVSALVMTVVYLPQPGSTVLLYVLRLLFGSAMAACVVLGITSIRTGDVAAHGAWMTRAYAIGLAAGTQVFTEGVGAALVGTSGARSDLARAAAWLINLVIAEWVIRRSARRGPAARSATQAAGATVAGSAT